MSIVDKSLTEHRHGLKLSCQAGFLLANLPSSSVACLKGYLGVRTPVLSRAASEQQILYQTDLEPSFQTLRLACFLSYQAPTAWGHSCHKSWEVQGASWPENLSTLQSPTWWQLAWCSYHGVRDPGSPGSSWLTVTWFLSVSHLLHQAVLKLTTAIRWCTAVTL